MRLGHLLYNSWKFLLQYTYPAFFNTTPLLLICLHYERLHQRQQHDRQRGNKPNKMPNLLWLYVLSNQYRVY